MISHWGFRNDFKSDFDCFAQGLEKADKGGTGYVKTTELADYVDNEVPILTEKIFKKAQYPTISISGQAFPIGRVK